MQLQLTKKMKAAIALFVLFAFVAELNAIPPHLEDKIPAELVELIIALRKICAGKNGLTDEEIDNYKIENTDEKFRCYMDCMMREAKWMTSDGTIHFELILDTSHPLIKPILQGAFDKCRTFDEGPETCGRAYGFNVCLSKADPVHYFLP